MKNTKAYLPVVLAVAKALGFPERRTRTGPENRNHYSVVAWSCENTIFGAMEETEFRFYLDKFEEETDYVAISVSVTRKATSYDKEGMAHVSQKNYHSHEFKRLTEKELLEDIQTWLKENKLNMSYWAV